MFLFKSHKTLSHRQCTIIGFVLAVLALLVMAIIVYGYPVLAAWLNVNGVYQLDMFIFVFSFLLLLSLEALILFGFPLYYAQDKKSHMTGFQILLYALMWMVILMAIIMIFSVQLLKTDVEQFDLSDFQFDTTESTDTTPTDTTTESVTETTTDTTTAQ